MKAQQDSGFRERSHTADWALDVWAPDLAHLLEQAARGMYVLMDIEQDKGARGEHFLHISAVDPEELLVSFLSELLYLGEMEGMVFDSFRLDLNGFDLSARLGGATLIAQAKEIKAVTYHNLKIQQVDDLLTCTIIFDV